MDSIITYIITAQSYQPTAILKSHKNEYKSHCCYEQRYYHKGSVDLVRERGKGGTCSRSGEETDCMHNPEGVRERIGMNSTEVTHLEPLSIGKGWLRIHPCSEEDGGHGQDGPGNDHEDPMCPNKDYFHNVLTNTHLPTISQGVSLVIY